MSGAFIFDSSDPLPPSTPLQGWCSLTDIPRITYLLEKIGLYRRIHLPAMVLRHHEQRIVEMQRGGLVDPGTIVAAPANVTTAVTQEAGDYTDA